MGILDQIANPQMADIAGALDYRQKRLDADEAKRKEIRLGQLIAEALPNFKDGSAIKEIAINNPREFHAITKSLGIPVNAGDRMQEFIDDTAMLYTLAQDDPRRAFEYAMELSEERKAQGRETTQIDRFIQGMREDAPRTMTGLFSVHRSLNPQREEGDPAGLREFEGMTQGLSSEEKEQARRVKLGIAPRAVGSADQTIATGGLTDVVAESKGTIAGTVKGAQETTKGNVNRAQDFINTGVASAEAIPNIKRAITLLDSVKTGGFNAVAARARQTFGIEGADEGELSSNLGKAVLSQLRQTFGAAFTEKEGERLERIEAGFGRNAETNRRILGQALQLLESKAQRGIKAAEEQGDDFAIQDINKYMQMSLDPEQQNQPSARSSTTETAAQRLARLRGGN